MAKEIWHRRDVGLMKQARQELFYWQYNNTGCFTHILFTLIAKADSVNRANLMRGFPEHVVVWSEWMNAPDSEGYFKEHGLL